MQEYGYTAFGKERFKDNTSAFNVSHRYTGQIFDDDTGLYYYNARYYDPEIGRFTQPDSVVQNPTDPQTLNRYSYVGNNPLNAVDPSGHVFWFVAGVVIGAAIGAGSAAAQGGNILLGALTGAIGGLFGGVGAVIGKALGGLTGAVVGGAIGGAIGGGISAGIMKGNVGLGILSGAVAGAIGGYVGFKTDGWTQMGQVAAGVFAGSLGGGISAAIQGGNIGAGFAYGAAGAGAAFALAFAANGIYKMWKDVMRTAGGTQEQIWYSINVDEASEGPFHAELKLQIDPPFLSS